MTKLLTAHQKSETSLRQTDLIEISGTPKAVLHSTNGEIDINLRNREIYLAGGNATACLQNTVYSIFKQLNKVSKIEPVHLTFFTEGIFGAEYVSRSDGKEYKDILRINDPLNMQKILEKLKTPEMQNDFIKDFLSSYFLEGAGEINVSVNSELRYREPSRGGNIPVFINFLTRTED